MRRGGGGWKLRTRGGVEKQKFRVDRHIRRSDAACVAVGVLCLPFGKVHKFDGGSALGDWASLSALARVALSAIEALLTTEEKCEWDSEKGVR